MRHVAFGTAQLFGRADFARSSALLEEAWRCGVRRFDTAPSYGAGHSEPHLGRFLASREGIEVVTTKVGMTPLKVSLKRRRVAARFVRRILPPAVMKRMRRAMHDRTFGHFHVDEVRTSVDESLRRLNGRIDRLMLHEVTPVDVTDEVLALLEKYHQRGDVGALGVATRNHLTADAVIAGGDLFTVVHLAVGPFDAPVPLPSCVTTRVGHGLLGDDGAQLRQMKSVLQALPGLADEWRDVTAGTEWADPGGLARVLLSRGPTIEVTDLIVSTTRLEHVEPAFRLAGRTDPVPGPVNITLAKIIEAARSL